MGLSWDGSVLNCYSTSDVSGYSCVGGLVGTNGWVHPYMDNKHGYIFNAYSTGSVQGALNVGGLVGYNELGDIEKSYWDITTSSEPNMCGSVDLGTGCDPNYGKTTAEMHRQSTFTDWDFINVWNIGEGQTYPYLRTHSPADLNKDRSTDFLDVIILSEQWCNEE